jgi:hypothetical protein
VNALPPVENKEKVRRDSVKALREAWPHRHTSPIRAGVVIRANVAMLRRLGGAK